MHKNVQKTFIVGDKWVYYKIYCGVNTADIILTRIIKPFTEQLLVNNYIDKWFFIRYSDPEPHIRVRFLVKDLEHIGSLILEFKKVINPFIKTKQIWDIQLATYQRELGRYGANSIELAESFFFYDSEQVLTIIENSLDDETRFLNMFQWIENVLSLFNLENNELLSFLNKMQEQFKKEFKVNKVVKKQLSNKYRGLETTLYNSPKQKYVHVNELKLIAKQFLALEKNEELQLSLENLIASYVHMTINRCFRSKQRLYEMMLYDFLFRKNKSKFIRYGEL